MKGGRRYSGALAMILLLGTALRFWHLTLKPLWLDEVITALFSLGQGYEPVPRQAVVPLSFLDQLFTLEPGATWAQISQLVTLQSVHPPLFFCGLHAWLQALAPFDLPLIWSLRALPALLGVTAIAAVYALNRIAFSAAAGLMAAALMAVSPFAVYLSQEARHYTLPILLITLALGGLVQIQQDLQRQQLRPLIWLGWIGINSLGFYTHYFFLLAVIAQGMTLVGMIIWQRRALKPRHWVSAGGAIAAILLSYWPWLPTLLAHMDRPETEWLSMSGTTWISYLAPLYQTLAGWVIMVIALPIENQPLGVALPLSLLMLSFTGWLAWQSYQGLGPLARNPQTQAGTYILLSFVFWVLVQFGGIVYLLGKDITIAPRYNFVYYPGVCALLGASLAHRLHRHPSLRQQWRQGIPLLVGVVSCLFVLTNLAFLKPFLPERVARHLLQFPTTPTTVLMAYQDTQDLALGLSLALAIQNQQAEDGATIRWGFVPHLPTEGVFPSILEPLTPKALNLWVVGRQWQQRDFPSQLRPSLNQQQRIVCPPVPGQAFKVGVPHRLYRCSPQS